MRSTILKNRGCESSLLHFLLVPGIIFFSFTFMVAQTKGQFNPIIEENSQAILQLSGVEKTIDSDNDTGKKNLTRLQNQFSRGWQTIMTEDFEGNFPSTGWRANANSGYANAYWDDASCNPHNGSWSAFCAKLGSQSVSCGQNYPNNMNSWMIYGPFDLSDATDAELLYYYWNNSESDYDFLNVYASINNYNFYGWKRSGNSNGWVSADFDLTDVYMLGNLLGQSEVWIAFNFTSDGSSSAEGAFVDDIVLRKYLSDDGNDEPTSATVISSIPHTNNYEINPTGDIDWYRVSLTAGQTYKFENSSSINLDTKFWLYGPGNIGGTNTGPLVAYDDDGGNDYQPLIIYTPVQTGYFYLCIAYYNTYAAGASEIRGQKEGSKSTLTTGPYTLNIGIFNPTHLVAGPNFKNIITLNWRVPSSAMRDLDNSLTNISNERYSEKLAVDYYKIYRKVTSSGSYALIGTTVRTDYIDINVTPGEIYFYRVTSIIGDVESGFSNESSAICNSTGYTFNLPTSTVSPTIDGKINTSEWSDAYILNIKNVLGVFNDPPNQDVLAYLKKVGNYLYLAVKDLGDIAYNTYDQIGFYFDNNNNNQWDVGDGNIWLYRTTASDSIRFREITGTYPDALQFGTPVDKPIGVAGAIALNTGHMEYEIRFDMTTSPFRPSGSSFGFWVFSLDFDRYEHTGIYPNAAVWTAPASYASVNISPTSIKDRSFSSIPDIYKLYQNNPNPFNPSTTIMYDLPIEGMVSIKIYDMLGREVKTLVNEYKNMGSYSVEFNASNLSSGTYFYRITTGDFTEIKKLILMK